MRAIIDGKVTPEYGAMLDRIEQLKAERGETKPFEIGKSYQMVGGGTVTCIELTHVPGYQCARFDDGKDGEEEVPDWLADRDLNGNQPTKIRSYSTGWRYNRDGVDRGRVTGTSHDHSDPRCVIPEPA